MAQSSEEKRRVEEQKRAELRSSETHALQKRDQGAMPLESIDFIYFAELMTRKVAFHYDVCKSFVILMGVENQYIDLDSQIIFLKENNFLPEKLKSGFNPMEPLRKGLLAYLLYRAMGVKGGITLRIFGINERHAMRELVYEGILSSGNVKDIVSGDELVSAINRTAEYIAKKTQVSGRKREERE